MATVTEPETYIVDLPIHPANADVAGAPAGMIEHYVRCVGRPQCRGAFTPNTYTADALATARAEAIAEGMRNAAEIAGNVGALTNAGMTSFEILDRVHELNRAKGARDAQAAILAAVIAPAADFSIAVGVEAKLAEDIIFAAGEPLDKVVDRLLRAEHARIWDAL